MYAYYPSYLTCPEKYIVYVFFADTEEGRGIGMPYMYLPFLSFFHVIDDGRQCQG